MHKITLVSPFPAGEGGWGIGGRIKTKGGAGRRPKRQAPPVSTTAAVSTGNAGGQALAGCLLLRFSLCRKRFSAGVPAWQCL